MPTLLHRFLLELGFALLEYQGGGSFVLLTEPPGWFKELWGAPESTEAKIHLAGKSPFLENFLQDAESSWKSPQPAEVQSDMWIEKSLAGREVPLQATALHLDGKRILALRSPDKHYREHSQLLQTARNSALVHEELLREIQKKEILLHCIVHDLSQPLSAMRAAFECLSAESVNEKVKGFADLGKLASEQQESMIVGILQAFSADLHTSLEGARDANVSPDLLACATAAMTTLSPAFEVKRVRLSFVPNLDGQADWHVAGEETRLRRVFMNLLENALRYTPAGAAVKVGLEQGGGICTAYVDDQGPGLPEDMRPAEIFALLSKGKEGGGKAGLGLYFCRITIERWGGSIGCASLLETGSRFWFHLPKAALAADSVPSPERALSPQPGRKTAAAQRLAMKILFADDQEDIRTLTTHQLERSGHKVLTVTNGKEALKAAQGEMFDVLLLDEEMPAMTGVQVAHAIREKEAASGGHAFLVAVTGNNTVQDRDRLLAAGFDAVVGKPFRMEALNNLFRGMETLRNSSAGAIEQDAPVDTDPILVLSQRVNGDKQLMKQMINTFLHDLPGRLASLRKAVQRKDAPELATQAHALKGTLSIFGAPQAHARAQELQDLGRSGDLRRAGQVHDLLKEEIANLEENLRGYAQQASGAPRSKGAKPQRPAGNRHKR